MYNVFFYNKNSDIFQGRYTTQQFTMREYDGIRIHEEHMGDLTWSHLPGRSSWETSDFFAMCQHPTFQKNDTAHIEPEWLISSYRRLDQNWIHQRKTLQHNYILIRYRKHSQQCPRHSSALITHTQILFLILTKRQRPSPFGDLWWSWFWKGKSAAFLCYLVLIWTQYCEAIGPPQKRYSRFSHQA